MVMKDPRDAQQGSKPEGERGVALLLTLGILSLLLVLAMGFAFSSRTNLMASQVNADMTGARLLCESGLERALAYIKYTFDNTNTPRDYYPASSGVLFTNTAPSAGLEGSDTNWRQRSYAVSRSSSVDRDGIGALAPALLARLSGLRRSHPHQTPRPHPAGPRGPGRRLFH